MSSSLSPTLYFEPRVDECRGHAGLRLGEAIELLLDSRCPVEASIVGPSAELAIAWARNHFGANPRLKWYQDEPFGNPTAIGIDADVEFTIKQERLSLAPLDRDDVIRYLLELRPECCGSVISRFRLEHFSSIGSDLRIWIPLLNEMAEREYACVDELLWTALQHELERYGSTTAEARLRILEQLKKQPPNESTLMWSLLSISTIQTRLTAEVVLEQLRRFSKTPLKSVLTREVILEVAEHVSDDDATLKFLRKCCVDSSNSMASSILHHSQTGWQPVQFFSAMLLGAQFDEAKWQNLEFKKSRLSNCDFHGSILENCSFLGSDFGRCDLSGASLRGTHIDATIMSACRFSDADITNSNWMNGSTINCDFTRAKLDASIWKKLKSEAADFQDVDFTDAMLTESGFVKCQFERTKLTYTRFQKCTFVDCKLGVAVLDESAFADCSLTGADFEGAQVAFMQMKSCFVNGSLWTGSKLSNCSLRFCTLHQARLAEIVWSDCDLRGVDLRGAIFHFGSTRCGLVGSPYPSHGTRTGFYTDVLEELYFKEKEQIRRAALLSCDLTGANLDGVDFYLVDLSGCKMDDYQRRQAIATGALGLD